MLQIEVIGNLGADAEIREFSGKRYVSFNVAHSERRKNADGTDEDCSTWVSVRWRGEGGGLFPYLKKGCKVFVRGRLSARQYQDKGGTWRVSIDCHATEVSLCGLKANEAPNSVGGANNAANTAAQNPNRIPF